MFALGVTVLCMLLRVDWPARYAQGRPDRSFDETVKAAMLAEASNVDADVTSLCEAMLGPMPPALNDVCHQLRVAANLAAERAVSHGALAASPSIDSMSHTEKTPTGSAADIAIPHGGAAAAPAVESRPHTDASPAATTGGRRDTAPGY